MDTPITYIAKFLDGAKILGSQSIIPIMPGVFNNAVSIMKEKYSPLVIPDDRTIGYVAHGARIFVYKDNNTGEIVLSPTTDSGLAALLKELSLPSRESQSQSSDSA